MQPEVVKALEALVASGVVTPEQAAGPLRASRGELLSVRFELRTLLWVGVSLVVAGATLLVKENLDRIGPLAIAIALGAAATGCLLWVARVAPRFSWHEEPSPNLAFDYILLMGAALVGADLAFIEVRFTALGAAWPWHLFVASLLYALLAVRFDSRVVLSLALSTFAAWRGVAIGSLSIAPLRIWEAPLVQANAVACGLLFVVGGWALRRLRRKAHFEPVAAHMGWLLVLGGLGAGTLDWYMHPEGPAWTAALLVVGAGLAWDAAHARRFWLLAMGVLGAYAAVSRFLIEMVPDGSARSLAFLVTSVALIVLLVVSRRRLAEKA